MATLGKTTVGGSTAGPPGDQISCSGPFTATEDGTITAIHIYTDADNSVLVMGVYNASGNEPTTLVAGSQTASGVLGGPSSFEWKSKASGGSLVNGQSYFIAYAPATSMNIKYDVTAKPGDFAAYTYDGTLPSTYPTSSGDLVEISIYVEYTPEAGGGDEAPSRLLLLGVG